MSTKLICHQNQNVTKIELSPKTEMSPKLKFHQNLNVTKAAMSPFKNYLNVCVTNNVMKVNWSEIIPTVLCLNIHEPFEFIPITFYIFFFFFFIK